MTRSLALGAFLYTAGHHITSWRHPSSQIDAGTNLQYFVNLAQLAERGKFDLVFLADSSAVRGASNPAAISGTARSTTFEPLTLLSALAMTTRHIGLIATATTTYNEPYRIARAFASLDHISGGRAGWNLVTSNDEGEAQNFGREEHPLHADRYARAREFVSVVTGLWDSWEDDAFIRDRASGKYFDPAKLHVLGHNGKHFSVQGPLNVARSPQGYPVLVQAGASEDGRDLAASLAEVVFTAQSNFEDAQRFYANIRERVRQKGRNPDKIKIMPGVSMVIGRSRQEAADKAGELEKLLEPEVGLGMLSSTIGGFDFSGFNPDDPVPDMPETNGPKSRQRLLLDAARAENLSIRALYTRVAAARGHWTIQGTPTEIADHLEQWFLGGAADGFNIMPPIFPQGLEDFVAFVVPELQRRGLHRTEYSGATLRDHLGLDRPPHPAAAMNEA